VALYEPTELRYWDEDKAYNGYTLFGAGGTTYLIDMEGNVVHTWPIGFGPCLLENGNLLDTMNGRSLQLQELDWNGNIVWEYVETREGYAAHHDFRRIFNKKLNAYTTMYIANKAISHDEAIAAGCNPDNGPYDGSAMDTIVEIDMDGNVIWEWWFFDHVVQDIDPTKPNYVGKGKTIADYPHKLNLNVLGRPLSRDFMHCNGMDYNAELDQVVTTTVHDEFYVVDHGNSFIPGDPEGSIALAAGPAGDFLYRFGDPARYGQGEPPAISESFRSNTRLIPGTKQIGGCHNVHWIRPGLPGAGNLMVFNNGQCLFEQVPQSYVFEINGFLDADGNDTGDYVNPPDAGYHTWELPGDPYRGSRQMSNQIVWYYGSQRNVAFFSHIGSGSQRLPNGNTLICAMTEGHFFEVTRDGEVVWEYINPVTQEHGPYERVSDRPGISRVNLRILEVLPDRLPLVNSVWRAHRYTADHPALAGKDLTPKGTITGKNPSI